MDATITRCESVSPFPSGPPSGSVRSPSVTATEATPTITAPAKAATFTHSASLDGLRAMAVLLVVIAHGSSTLLPKADRITTGHLGVEVFFVLSGYLITSLLLREYENRGRISLKDFYIRRALRIWPLYYAVLVLLLVVLIHVNSKAFGGAWVSTNSPRYELLGDEWWSYLFFLQNYVSDPKHVPLSLAVYWSLAIEEQFYLFWPLILIGLTRFKWRWTVPTFLIAAITVSFILRALTIQGHLSSSPGGAQWMTHTNIFGLAIGCLLAWSRWTRLKAGNPPRAGGGFGAALGWIVLLEFVLQNYAPTAGWAIKLPHGGYYEPLLLSIAVAAIIDHFGEGKYSPLRWPPVVYIGRVSYGMYLLHTLVWGYLFHNLFFGASKGWPQMIVYVLATIGAAALSYELFEKRVLRLKRRFSHVPSEGTEPPKHAKHAS